MSVRVYFPATMTSVRLLLEHRELGPGPMSAFAVTPALRESYAEGGLEELEQAAMAEAARASLRLLALDPAAQPRRVVLAADVPEGALSKPAGGSPASVRVSGTVALAAVAAAHVDDAEAEADVRAAAAAIGGADAGDEDAAFVVDGAEGNDLLWFATQELGDLVRAAGGA